MKCFPAAHAFLAITFLAFALPVACTQAEKRAINTALDVASYACIIANASSDDATIQDVCKVADDLLPAMKQVVIDFKAKRDAYAREQVAAQHCPPAAPADAGAKK